jgi:NADH-quinone oxidoreductase subunit L
VTVPLVLLAIPSLVIGWFTIGPVLFGDYFAGALSVLPEHDVLDHLAEEWHGPAAFVVHGLKAPAVWLALAGVLAAWFLYLRRPELAALMRERAGVLHNLLVNKYYFDWFNESVLAAGARLLGRGLWRIGDVALIDGTLVNGSARAVGWLSGVVRNVQTGYLYTYAFVMIIGLAALLGWYVVWR